MMEKGSLPGDNSVWQGSVDRNVGEILLTGVEPQERSALLRDMLAKRSAQHRVANLDGIEYRAYGYRRRNVDHHLAIDARQCS